MSKRKAVWIVAVLLALVFGRVGATKLSSSSAWTPLFARWGYPPFARPLVGAIEVSCALGLLVPRVRRFAAAVLVAIMAGAAVTHLMHGEAQRVAVNAVLSALLGLLMWLDTRSVERMPDT